MALSLVLRPFSHPSHDMPWTEKLKVVCSPWRRAALEVGLEAQLHDGVSAEAMSSEPVRIRVVSKFILMW